MKRPEGNSITIVYCADCGYTRRAIKLADNILEEFFEFLPGGVTIVPDFIANAGGVICAAMEFAGATQSAAFDSIAEKIRANTEAVLAAAARDRVLPRAAALALAEQRVRDAMRFRRFGIL